jgi:hypothetical protein
MHVEIPKETRCPFCDAILDDDWVKKAGASVMGRVGRGEAKARSSKITSDGAIKRWSLQDKLDAAEAENERLRKQLRKKK